MDEARRVSFARKRINRSERERSSRRVLRMLCHASYPRREWSRRESSDMDVSPLGRTSGASESIEVNVHYFLRRVSCAPIYASYPRRESNPHLRFRKPPFYPLNYGDGEKGQSRKAKAESKRGLAEAGDWISDFRSQRSECRFLILAREMHGVDSACETSRPR